MRDSVAPYGSLQSPAEKPTIGSVRVDKGGEILSNLAMIGGLGLLLASAGLYAAIKTWQSWEHEVSLGWYVDWSHIWEEKIQVIDGCRGGMWGLGPLVVGILGVGACSVYSLSRRKEKLPHSYYAVIGAVVTLCLAAIAYGAAIYGLEDGATLRQNKWYLPYNGTHWRLNSALFSKLERTGIALMATGGVVCAGGIGGRIVLRLNRGRPQ